MKNVSVEFKLMNKDARLPSFGSEASAGMDLTATSVEVDYERGLLKYGTGVAMSIKDEVDMFHNRKFVCKLHPRSSIMKKDLMMWNSTGIIDMDYRGEMFVAFRYLGNPNDLRMNITDGILKDRVYQVGDRIAQIIIEEIPNINKDNIKIVTDLDSTTRGTGGFGSTGN